MNSIEQNMLMTTNNTLEILNRMGPARNNMAVVEPVPDPIPAEPPDMASEPVQTHNEFDNMDIDASIIIHSTNETNQPMIDPNLSIEEKELEYPENQYIDWIDNKIIFNPTN